MIKTARKRSTNTKGPEFSKKKRLTVNDFTHLAVSFGREMLINSDNPPDFCSQVLVVECVFTRHKGNKHFVVLTRTQPKKQR